MTRKLTEHQRITIAMITARAGMQIAEVLGSALGIDPAELDIITPEMVEEMLDGLEEQLPDEVES